ncbi:uncharacterized protein LOC121387834 [Gigantopelta aegis]|uniref:uncharacterized protein LOC121387834 n=1 Tax=Gigantopelta aegis TaxID=1735272 RepID=UPI001B88D950|nr:uncharacterized protein LOC121387834 [Gigantopelta aegis]
MDQDLVQDSVHAAVVLQVTAKPPVKRHYSADDMLVSNAPQIHAVNLQLRKSEGKDSSRQHLPKRAYGSHELRQSDAVPSILDETLSRLPASQLSPSPSSSYLPGPSNCGLYPEFADMVMINELDAIKRERDARYSDREVWSISRFRQSRVDLVFLPQ